MPYTADKPKLKVPLHERAATIPGWGADKDPAMRPGFPKEQFDLDTGAHWTFPERQPERLGPREKSTEHMMLPPVFGTSCPLKGLSGVVRRLAYKRFSEGQTTHWLLLVMADRIDVVESFIMDALRGRPDNFVAEYGIKAELTRHGLKSRLGRHRADTKRLPIELLFFGATWLGLGALLGGLGLKKRKDRKVRERTVRVRIRGSAPRSHAAPAH